MKQHTQSRLGMLLPKLKLPLLFYSLFFVIPFLSANNLQLYDVRILNRNTNTQTADILFNIQWDNSWRITDEPANHDAVWVFFKYYEDGEWKHVYFDNIVRAVPAACNIQIAPDGRGVMISRSDEGGGSVLFENILLKWNYAGSLLNDTVDLRIKAFGMEMVYVPDGAFYLGASGSGMGEFRTGGSENEPYYIESENAIDLHDLADGLWNNENNINSTIGSEGELPIAYPKGVNDLYCMKYEISQQQYVEFLNTLTDEQVASRRNDTAETTYGHSIYFDGEKFVASIPDRACAYLCWADDAAYADWAGMRPMTELEFEKICRGTSYPVPNEFAWGDSIVRTTPFTAFINTGTPDESFENMLPDVGNATYHATTFGFFDRPYRCGLFADAAINVSRRETGGTYYGVMDMSGNLWERVVNVVNAPARAYTGNHGDGVLTNDGYADVVNWPGSDAIGIGKRGGMWRHPVNQIYISDRQFAASTENDRRRNSGFRGIISDL